MQKREVTFSADVLAAVEVVFAYKLPIIALNTDKDKHSVRFVGSMFVNRAVW